MELHVRLTLHLDPEQFAIMAQGLADLTAATAALATNVAAVATDGQALITALQSASGDSDAAVEAAAVAVESANATLESLDAQLKAALPAPKPTSLTVTPATASIPVGSTTPVAVSVTGGTGAITASGLPSGVTYDGTANLVPDGTQVAGDSTVTFSDASTPPLTGTLALTIA